MNTASNIRDRALEILEQKRGVPITMAEAIKLAQAEKFKDRDYHVVASR